MPTIIDSLFVALGFKVNPEGLEGFAKKTEEAKSMALGLGAALAGAVYGIEHMVHGAVERMGGIQDFSEQMGLSARSVDALGRVARENESSLEAMEGGIRGLTMMAIQADKHLGRGAMVFKKFGLEARDSNRHLKSAETLMGEVADKMVGLSVGERNLLGSRLGFDPATVLLLSKGRANFNKLREEALKATPFSDEDYEQAEVTEKAFRKAGDAVNKLKERLAIGLLPTVNVLLARFKGWAQDEGNITKIKDAINKVVEVAGFLVRNMKYLVAVFAIMKAHTYGTMIMGWGASLISVASSAGKAASASAALAMGFRAIQGVLTGGVLALLLLAAEDLYTFHRGGVSVTGWLLQEFPYAVEMVEGLLVSLGAAFVTLATGSGPLGLLVIGIGGIIIAAKDLHDAWNPVTQWWAELWDGMFNDMARVWNAIPKSMRMAMSLASGGNVGYGDMDLDVLKKNQASRSKLGRDLKGYAPLKGDEEGGPAWLNKSGSPFMRGSPLVSHSAAAYNSTVHVGAIHVHGAGDPKAVAKAVREELYSIKGNPYEKDIRRAQARNGQSGRAL